MKPIEPGCLAIVINSRAGHDGLPVTVIKFVGKVPGWGGSDRWMVDKQFVGRFGTIGNAFRETQLLRIDGYDPEAEPEVTDLPVILGVR